MIKGVSVFERPKTAQEAVLLELRRQLLDGSHPPGSALRPDAIGADLGVSAVPVREALRILEGEGHVDYRPHRGYVVTDLDIDDLKEIYRIRELLETEAVCRAIPKLEAPHHRTLAELVEEMEAVEHDVIQLRAVNRRFHFTVFEAADMPQLARVLRILWDSSDRYRSRYLSSPENRQLVREQHRRILKSIQNRDVQMVNEEMRLHRKHAIKALAHAVNAANTANEPSTNS